MEPKTFAVLVTVAFSVVGGVLYSLCMILLLTAIGVVAFRESLSGYEIVGLVLAGISLVLLMRFA